MKSVKYPTQGHTARKGHGSISFATLKGDSQDREAEQCASEPSPDIKPGEQPAELLSGDSRRSVSLCVSYRLAAPAGLRRGVF